MMVLSIDVIGDAPMLDTFYILLGTALFAALALYTRACGRL